MDEPMRSPRLRGEPRPEERQRVDSLVTLAADAAQADPRRALQHAEQARELATAMGYDAGLAAALAGSGVLHRVLGEHGQARLDALQALALYEAIGDPSGRVRM